MRAFTSTSHRPAYRYTPFTELQVCASPEAAFRTPASDIGKLNRLKSYYDKLIAKARKDFFSPEDPNGTISPGDVYRVKQ